MIDERRDTSMGRIVDIDYSDILYYGVMHRRLVREIRIENLSVPENAGDFTVRCWVEGPTDEVLLHEYQVSVPCGLPGSTRTLRGVDMPPNHRMLAQLDEMVPAQLVAELSIGDELVETKRLPVQALAYNQWMHREDCWDSLAGFVLPTHPALYPILDRARELLGERTGDPSTDSYQSGRDRVRHIAAALFDSLKEAGLDLDMQLTGP